MPAVNILDRTTDIVTLEQLACSGCVRSAHVGLLSKNNTTIAALASGVRTELHEFMRHAGDANYDVCSHSLEHSPGHFVRIPISDDRNIWGPLAQWAPHARELIANSPSIVATVARVASTPFAFHLAATKLSFRNRCVVSTCSSALLSIGTPEQAKGALVAEILRAIATPRHLEGREMGGRPSAFYRVIDEAGQTFPLDQMRKIKSGSTFKHVLCYDNGFQILLDQAPDNVLETFLEMETIERDPSTVLQPRPRLVMDTAFYLVCSIVDCQTPTSKNAKTASRPIVPGAIHLAGNEMMNYLIHDEKVAPNYRRQINNTYAAIAARLGLPPEAEFCLYPAVRTNGHDQYTLTNCSYSFGKLLAGAELRQIRSGVQLKPDSD